MLVSPARLHKNLTSLLATSSSTGPHTALLILPQGRLLVSATNYNEAFPDEEADDEDTLAESVEMNGNGTLTKDYAGDAEDDEDYLYEPERMRLLCGLASQWEEDESPKVECELGRLLLTPIPLHSSGAQTSMTQNLPASKPISVKMFILVLNGGDDTPWSTLTAKAEEFKKLWDAMPH